MLADYVSMLTRLTGYEKLATDTSIRNALMDTLEITEIQLDELLQTDLNNYAEVWGILRTIGAKAKGPIKYVFSNDNPVSIPESTKLTSIQRRKEYTTIEPITGRIPTLENGLYIIRCFIECIAIGNDGNITAGSILLPDVKINNLVKCEIDVNIENGEDVESNVDFVARIRLARFSRGVGSRSYLRNLLLADSRVYDVWLNAKGDSGFDRPLGIDAWVYAQETPKVVSETAKIHYGYILESQPLIDGDAIITGGYVLVRDTNSYERSVESVDNISGPSPQTIQYYTDDTIRSLQLDVEDQDRWLLGGRRLVLIKKALKVEIDFSIKLYVVFNAVVSTIKTNIENNLLCYFAGGTTTYGETFSRTNLGKNVEKSDVLNIILNTENVDRVDLNSFRVRRNDGRYATTDPVLINNYEFSALGSVQWT